LRIAGRHDDIMTAAGKFYRKRDIDLLPAASAEVGDKECNLGRFDRRYPGYRLNLTETDISQITASFGNDIRHRGTVRLVVRVSVQTSAFQTKRFHIFWITNYRQKVLRGDLRERVRVIIRQVYEELVVTIVSGVLSSEHVYVFVSIPPKLCVSEALHRLNGRWSRKIQP